MARLAYSPDGRRLVSATRLRPLEIWDTESGRLALVLDRVVDGADCAAFTPDGRQLYSGLGALIRFWDTADQDRHERLRMADEHAVAWHRRWYPICQKEENWAGTALHLNYLIKTNPTEGLYREQLADAIGNLGLWDQAWSENELAIELGRRNGLTFYDRACFALRSGDLPTYRQTCLDALDLIPANADAAKANTLSWISLMHPSAPGDPLRLVELAESAVKKQPKSSVYRNTLGAALYRAGLYNDAIVQLHAAIDAQDRKLGTSFDWVFLAMAYAKTGDRTKAQYWLDKVVAAPDANDWQTQLEVRLLRAEAADAIHTMSPSAQATDSL
jgi:tetratricopeptide (TPR) repeat protein